MAGKLCASIPKDTLERKIDDISVGDLKEILQTTGLSRIQPFLPEKKKYEIEVYPAITPEFKIPQFNEKKKYEIEVPPEIFNSVRGGTIEDLLDHIENEYKKAAIEVPDWLDQISKIEENHFDLLGDALSKKSFK